MIDILYTSLTGYPTQHSGGGNRIIYDLIKNISTDRFSKEYFSFTYQNKYYDKPFGIDSHQMLSPRKKIGFLLNKYIPLYKNIVSSPQYSKWYLKRLENGFTAFVDQNSADIVHSHDPLALYYFKNHNNNKKILTIHSKGGTAFEMRKARKNTEQRGIPLSIIEKMEHVGVQSADHITFPSRAAKDLFIANNDIVIPEEKIRIIYNGVDIDSIKKDTPGKRIFQKYDIRVNATMYIFNVAEHVAQKDIPLLLKVINILVKEWKKDVVFINVGIGDETPNLFDMVKNLELQNNVKFLGTIPNEDIISFMKSTDCFVMTSKQVIFDLVVLEALASETAVFVTDDGGNKEIIEHGVNGYLHQSNNERAIAESLIKNDFTRIRNGARVSISNYSVKKMVKEYEQLYDLVSMPE